MVIIGILVSAVVTTGMIVATTGVALATTVATTVASLTMATARYVYHRAVTPAAIAHPVVETMTVPSLSPSPIPPR